MGFGKYIEIQYYRQRIKNQPSEKRMGKIKDIVAPIINYNAYNKNSYYI
jgi:hypothetical protein